jgi:tetratricopeptide (TPR) repeat protein
MITAKDYSDPSPEPQQNLERAYDYAEKFEDALRECEIAIHLAPEWAEAHNLRGIILEELGHEEQAIAAYREAVHLDPDFQEAQQNLRELELEHTDRKREPNPTRVAIGYGLSGCALGFLIPVVIVTICALLGIGGRIPDLVARSSLFLMLALGIIGYIYGKWNK